MWRRCCCICLRDSYEPPEVTELDYRHNSLTEVPAEIFTYERTLEKLYLGSNQINDLPPNLFHCHELRELEICDNELKEIPPAIESLNRLTKLNVNRNGLQELPDTIKNCRHLIYLDLGTNQLTKVPESICQLVHLEELFLNETGLEFLPANFGRLTRLKNLELRDNALVSLPMSLKSLTQLQRLDIGCNEMDDLPLVIGAMTNLQELWADDNAMQQDSNTKVLGSLTKLTCLDLSKNNVVHLSDQIGRCSHLLDLTLSFNDITELPATFTKLENVTVVRLDCNRLTRLPEDLGRMKNLQELNVSYNALRAVPQSVGLLRKLHTLYLDENQLRDLPKEIGSCTSLTVLSVANNGLRDIPSEIGHLSNLKVLVLTNNYIHFLPVSILGLTRLAALWLTEGQNKPMVALNREIDNDTGQHVVTCCLLPQIPAPAIPIVRETDKNKEELLPIRSARKIRFENEIEPPSPEKPAVNGGLLRAPTPYPKELRAMAKHASHIRQSKSQNGEAVNISDEPMYEGDMNEDSADDFQSKQAFELTPINETHEQQDNQPSTSSNYRPEEGTSASFGIGSSSTSSTSHNQEALQYPTNEQQLHSAINGVSTTATSSASSSSRDYNYQTSQQQHRTGAPGPQQPQQVEVEPLCTAASAVVVVTSVASSSSSYSAVGRTPPPYHIAAQRAAFFRSSGGAGTGKINFPTGEMKNSASAEAATPSPMDTPRISPDLASASGSNNISYDPLMGAPLPQLSSSNGSSGAPPQPLPPPSSKVSGGGGGGGDPTYNIEAYESAPSNLNEMYLYPNQSGIPNATTERINPENGLLATEMGENIVPGRNMANPNSSTSTSSFDGGIHSDRNGNITSSKPYTAYNTESSNAPDSYEETSGDEAMPLPMPLLADTKELLHHSQQHHHPHPLASNKVANSALIPPEGSHIPKPGSFKTPDSKVCRIPSLQSTGAKRHYSSGSQPSSIASPSRIPSSSTSAVDSGGMDAGRPTKTGGIPTSPQAPASEHHHFGKATSGSRIPGGFMLSSEGKSTATKRNAGQSQSGNRFGSGSSSGGPTGIPRMDASNTSSPGIQQSEAPKVYSRIPKLDASRALAEDGGPRPSSSMEEEKRTGYSGASEKSLSRGISPKLSRSGMGRESDHGLESRIPTTRKPWIFGSHRNARVVSVEHRKLGQSNLGFSIIEYSGQTAHPEGKGIYVTAADSEGLPVKVGDKILQVDGIDVGDMSVDIVNKILSNCQETIQLLVSRQH